MAGETKEGRVRSLVGLEGDECDDDDDDADEDEDDDADEDGHVVCQ